MRSKFWRSLKIHAEILLKKICQVKNPRSFRNTRLNQCLTTFDIIFFGIGNMVGAGIYRHTGTVIKNITGPAIFLSYLLAGVAAFLSALCYAELTGRIPTAGSAYSFTYVSLGELYAFLVGWNMLLENVIGAAAVAKTLSGSFDYLIENKIQVFILQKIGPMPDNGVFGSEEGPRGPDLLAVALIVMVSLMVCLGSRRSANFNSCFTILSLCVITFVISYGMTLKTDSLWTDITLCPNNCTVNGTLSRCSVTSAFIPYGPFSVLTGASQVYFAYIGFNQIASAGEETKDPKRSLPFGTMISMVIVIVAYVLMSATLSLMVPYCNVSIDAPFATAFLTLTENRYIYTFISIGALSAMITVLFGNLWVMLRTIYAMASDGMLFEIFSKIYSKTQVPIVGALVFGLVAAVLASCFKLDALLETTTIGTLISYSIVACCVILLRYRQDSIGGKLPSRRNDEAPIPGQLKVEYASLGKHFPENFPSKPIPYIMLFLIPCLAGIAGVIKYGSWSSPIPRWLCLLVIIILGICSLLCVFAVYAQNPSPAILPFKVPFVPILPVVSLFLNILLMANLESENWGRFAVLLTLGIIIYLAYGLGHSKLNQPPAKKPPTPSIVGCLAPSPPSACPNYIMH